MYLLLFALTGTLLFLIELVPAEPIGYRRADVQPLGQFFAYGTNITGQPVFVADGIAYLGNVSTSTISGASNVTFTLSATEVLAYKQVSNSSGTTTNSSDLYLAIDTTSSASEPVLVGDSTSVSNYTMDGYNLYGSQLTWLDSDRMVESNFYALTTDTDGIWKLYWDADDTAGTKGTIVVLKTLPPPTLPGSA